MVVHFSCCVLPPATCCRRVRWMSSGICARTLMVTRNAVGVGAVVSRLPSLHPCSLFVVYLTGLERDHKRHSYLLLSEFRRTLGEDGPLVCYVPRLFPWCGGFRSMYPLLIVHLQPGSCFVFSEPTPTLLRQPGAGHWRGLVKTVLELRVGMV